MNDVRNHPGPIVLLTDFGLQDWFVGVIKGELLRVNPRAVTLDLCHAIAPGNVGQAAFVLLHTRRHFPAGTIFCCVVDPGVGSERKALLAQSGGQLFLAPDNGLLSPIREQSDDWVCFQISNPDWMNPQPSNTFHGRDIFAPAAAHCSLGEPLENAGPPCAEIVRLELPDAVWLDDKRLQAQVMHVDRFGNLILNLEQSDYRRRAADAALRCVLGGETIRGVRTAYHAAAPGSPLFYWGSLNLLELGVNGGSAAQRLRLGAGDTLELTVGA